MADKTYGYWKKKVYDGTGGGIYYECSNCGITVSDGEDYIDFGWCPYCGDQKIDERVPKEAQTVRIVESPIYKIWAEGHGSYEEKYRGLRGITAKMLINAAGNARSAPNKEYWEGYKAACVTILEEFKNANEEK